MSNTTGGDVINKLKDIFARWGISNEIVSDNGAQFSSDQFSKFSLEYDVTHSTTSSHHPQEYRQAGKMELSTHRKEDIKPWRPLFSFDVL